MFALHRLQPLVLLLKYVILLLGHVARRVVELVVLGIATSLITVVVAQLPAIHIHAPVVLVRTATLLIIPVVRQPHVRNVVLRLVPITAMSLVLVSLLPPVQGPLVVPFQMAVAVHLIADRARDVVTY